VPARLYFSARGERVVRVVDETRVCLTDG